MPNIYGLLSVGRVALATQQKAIDVTGNNIANVNTPGYSRQRLNMESTDPIRYGAGQMSRGVRANRKTDRMYDQFLGSQINNENQSLGKWEAQKNSLEKVEMIFDEASGNGLNQAMGDFWNAWQDLANNPSGHVERVELLAKSQTMTGMFNKIASDLEQTGKDMDTNIKGTVDEINLLAKEIADLNEKIRKAEVGGHSANEFRDQRDLVLKELSGFMDINSFENNQGHMTVLTGGGHPLVEGVSAYELTTEINDGHYNVEWIDSNGNQTDITGNISGGKLKGWIETRDVAVPDYLARMDSLAASIMTEVNTLHQAGYDLNDDSGGIFFSGASALDMSVDSALLADTDLIAAARFSGYLTDPSHPGDNRNALAIAELQNSILTDIDSSTFDDYYNSIVSDVGSSVKNAGMNYNHQASVTDQLANYRETVSGVSLDEEMVNLVKFQHAYDAAAKLISTVDELLATLMNI
ncbi:MAG: flagellar hook-associated protein FlgK [Deltaproteobacteria bacterium]|nr:flagellar hook-associated protein FlgK [Deltaproteobacteria bacterium]